MRLYLCRSELERLELSAAGRDPREQLRTKVRHTRAEIERTLRILDQERRLLDELTDELDRQENAP